MADQVLGNLVWKITGDSTNFDKQIGKSETKLTKFGKKASQVGKSLTKYVTLPIVGLGVAAVKLASDLEESLNAVSVVFEDASGTIEAFGEVSATAAGLSQSEFNGLATVIGAQLKQSGKDINDVADDTVNLTQRAADLASVYNTDVKDAAGALGAALRGESEPARRFGILLSDAAVQAEALASGLVKNKSEITDQIKVQARYNLILQQSADVAGDFQNTSDGLANSTRILLADVKDLGADLGKVLLPIAKDLITGIKNLVSNFNELDDSTKKTIVTILGIAAAAGPAIGAIGAISTAMSFLAANPAVIAVAAIAAITLAVIALGAAKDKARLEEYIEDIHDMAIAAGVAEEAISELAKELDDLATISDFVIATNMALVAEEVGRVAKQYGITRQEAVKLIKANDDISDSMRAVLDIYGKQFAELDAINKLSQGTRNDMAAMAADAEYIAGAEERARIQADAKAKAEEAAADALAEQNRLLKEQILDQRAAYYATYLEQLKSAQTARNLEIISEEELLSLRLSAQEQYVQSLIDSGITNEKTFGTHIQLLKDLRAEYAELNEERTQNDKTYAEGYLEQLAIIEAAEKEGIENKKAAEKEARDEKEAADEEAAEKTKQRIQDTLTISQSVYSSLSSITGAYFNYKTALAGEDEAEQKRIARQQFEINKALQIANVAINTASAIIGFLANPGGPAGVGLSILAGLTGGVQAGIIAATPAPAFANGVNDFMVPPGYPNDSYPIMVQSGESVTVKTPEQQAGGSGKMNVTINNLLNTDSEANMQRAARLLLPYIRREEARSG